MKFNFRNILLSIFLISLSFIFIKKFSKPKCDKVVILSDGTEIRCKYVQSYTSGVSNLKTCSDTSIQIKSNLIKTIKIKY